MNHIRSDMIVEVKDIKMGFHAKLFYLWLVARFGHGRYFRWIDCKDFGSGRRQIFRYLKELKENDMVRKKKIGLSKRTTFYQLI